MKKLYTILATLALALGVASCSHDDAIEQILQEELQQESSKASMRVMAYTADTETRTELSSDFEVLWSEDDQIKIDDYTFKLVEGAGTTAGTFECTSSGIRDGEYTVYYPSLYNGSRWVQQIYHGPNGIKRAPMVGTVTVKDGVLSPISFKNAGGVLRYTVKGDESTTINYVEITSGTNNLDIVLDCKNGLQLSPQGAVFNLALPPGTYQNATLTFYASDRKTATKKASELKVTQNMVSLATIDNLVFKTPEPDYLLMFYGTGSQNLDLNVTRNILQMLSAGTDSRVKTTFQYKLSVDYQESCPEFNGVRFFTGDDNLHFKGAFAEDNVNFASTMSTMYNNYLSKIRISALAPKTYNVSRPEALADFIKWSKEKYPNAKRTILVLNNHGNGWSIVNDGRKDYQAQTRALLIDDYANKILSLKNVVDGVIAGAEGKVDLLYTDACQMGVYENLYGYASCCNYLLSSTELTSTMGGDYPALMKALKATTGTSDEEFEQVFSNLCDQSVSPSWWGTLDNFYADIALYNLTKLSTLTPVLQEVAETLAEKYTSEESVIPTVEVPPLGDQFAAYIRSAAGKCMYTSFYTLINKSEFPSSMITYLKMDGIVANYWGNYDFSKIVQWARFGGKAGAEKALAENPEDFAKLKKVIAGYSACAFSLTDLLRNLDNSLTAAGAQNNPFTTLRTNLLNALKEVAHINCVINDEKPGIDQAYELCSPGITLLPLGPEAYYYDWNVYPQKYIPSHEDALKYYQALDFDQQVGWSSFLQKLDVVPSVITNPTRKEVK